MLKEMTEYFAGEKQESLLFIAVGLIAIGVAVWFWANGQSAPAQFKQDEVGRMQTVMKNFNFYKTIEMVLLVVGVCLIGFLQRFDVAAGIGAGLVLQAGFTLALDMFAESRGQDYLVVLNALAP